MSRANWLTTGEFAQVANISEQKARLALNRAVTGYTWRSISLVVRTGHGRGGLRGQHYAVWSDSLPLDLQQRWRELSGPVEAPLKLDDATMAMCQWRHALIQPALAAPKRSA